MQATGGATPLMYACQQYKENEVLEILRKQPYSVSDRDRTFKTPLHYCAENPNTNCAEVILKALPELVNAQDDNGYCTLHLAVIAGNKPLIKLLISKGADVNIHDNEGHSAVHWAIVSSEKEALEIIIRAGANPSTPDIHGGYPLHYAVQMCGCNCDYARDFEDAVRVVETLLNFGVDVNVKDKDGRQPILWAASAGSADAVIHLISGGACVEAADKDGLTALHCAASRGHTTTLETLITLCGANVDVIDGNGCSALFYSVTLGHADATELLLQLGAEPNRQDRKGRTPAHCGAAKGQLETLRILHKHGGNLWMRNVRGDIPLHEAVASGRKDLVLWLLSQCSEAVNIANNDGRCPLHIASMYNNTEMVKVLLDSKSLVNPVMRTSKGVLMTPLNVALSRGHRSCGKYLQLHGGVPFSKVSQVESGTRVSDRVTLEITEKGRESGMQFDISKSRSSTDVQDIQDIQDITKTEAVDKKKVYRRRKRKKNPSSVNTKGSDSDESVSDFKAKTPEIRNNGEVIENKENERGEKMKTLKVQTNTKGSIQMKQTKKNEIFEEPSTVTKMESKPLQRNKSFNETKNVSDLSPEDFPPLMQTIDHLDIVIMEPDIEVRKSETESNEPKPQEVLDLVSHVMNEGSKEEESNVNDLMEPTTVYEEVVQDRKKNGEEHKVQGEEKEVKVQTVKNSVKEEKIQTGENSGKEEKAEVVKKDGRKEKSEEVLERQKPNGKHETGRMSSGGKNSEESSTKRGKKIAKSSREEVSQKKETKGLQKSDGGHEEKGSRTASPKHSETPYRVEEKSADEVVEKLTKTAENGGGSVRKDEKVKTEPEIQNEIVITQNIETTAEGLEEVVREPKSEENNEAKCGDSSTLNSAPPKEETSSVGREDTAVPMEAVETYLSEMEPSMTEVKTEGKTVDVETEKLEVLENLEELEGKIFMETGSSNPSESVAVPIAQNAIEKNNISELNRESHVPPEEQSEQNSGIEEGMRKEGEEKEAVTEQIEKIKGRTEEGSDSSAKFKTKVNGRGDDVKEDETEVEGEDEDDEEGEDSPKKKTSFQEHRLFKPPRVSGLCRRGKDFKDDGRHISVTQLVQNTIRKYHMERGIFYQLLELKRYQIRSGRANEQVLVKRLADEYERSRVFLGMKPFTGLYKFREFEKFLYDQLKALNSRRSFIIPDMKSYDDIDVLSGFLKKSRYKIINEAPPPELICTCITQRCHHSACAYTSVPCSAYITDLHRHKHHRPRRESFFPRIDQVPPGKIENQRYKEKPATLELIQGSEKHVINLPENSPSTKKRYYVTFTIKGAPDFKEEDFPEESRNYWKHRHAKSV